METPRAEIHILEVTTADGTTTARIRHAEKEHELYFRFGKEHASWVSTVVDPFVCAMIIPAMLTGSGLRSDLPVSPKLLRGLGRIQRTMAIWYPEDLREIPILAEPRPLTTGNSPSELRTGSFFSGGVDSTSTVLDNLAHPRIGAPPLTHALFMRGLEVPLDSGTGTEAAAAQCRETVEGLGLQLIEGETNLRSLFPVDWAQHWCGTGLAATALALAGGFSRFLIPSSTHVGRGFKRFGSTAHVDEAASSDTLEIVEDLAEWNRADKFLHVLRHHPEAVARLRFCVVNGGGTGNCGRCRKCVRTMMILEAAGLSGVPQGTGRHLSPEMWRRYEPFGVTGLEACIQLAQAGGGNPALERRLHRKIDSTVRRQAVIDFVKHSPLKALLPARRYLRRLFGRTGSR